MAQSPNDVKIPSAYASGLEQGGDSRARLLRLWVDLAFRASHASLGFRALLANDRRSWLAADPEWRRAFGEARPWVDPFLAEELCRGYFRSVEEQSTVRRTVIPGSTGWYQHPTMTNRAGWLTRYHASWEARDSSRRIQEYEWFIYIQPELGWVYPVATCGPNGWLALFDVTSGEKHAF